MGVIEESTGRSIAGRNPCEFCGLPQDRVATLSHEFVLLEPNMEVSAHLIPAESRWITVSDGQVVVYGVCPPDTAQLGRIEHRLVCPEQELPDLWPWLTELREKNAWRAQRLVDPPPPDPGEDAA
ncbi:DUF6083 domain-containing protein [Streptomyces sp. NPDC050264]|uniref:DUF6083 domain-containing protein n=1 Tax=Streptomyces sp. NPDC050264 TaxID=3155038 RepID=UPI0034441D6A